MLDPESNFFAMLSDEDMARLVQQCLDARAKAAEVLVGHYQPLIALAESSAHARRVLWAVVNNDGVHSPWLRHVEL